MDCLLRFKLKSHHDAYTHDILHQLSKRVTLSIILFLIYLASMIAIFIADPEILPPGAPASIGIRMGISVIYVIIMWILRWKANKLQRKIKLINTVLDIIGIVTSYSLYPLFVNVNLDKFGPMGIMVWGWSNSSLFFSFCTVLASWWSRILGVSAQMVNFLVFSASNELHSRALIIFGIEAVLFCASSVYIVEWYERKHFLELQRAQENSGALKKIFEDINEGIVIFDKKLQVLYANKIVSTVFGMTEEALSVERILESIKVRGISPAIEGLNLDPLINVSLKNISTHYTLLDFSDEILNHLFSLTSLPSSENTISVDGYMSAPANGHEKRRNFLIKLKSTLYMNKQVIVANIHDTTDRDELIAAQDNDNYKTRLLASVSHELRTPLNGSINFTEQALYDPTVPEKIKQKWLLPALRSNRLLLSLINDILDFSQMQENKLRLVFEHRDIISTAKECVELLEIQAEKKGISLRLENLLPADIFIFSTDHNRFRQIILNLLSNAVKFTFEGLVTLRLEEIPSNDNTEISVRRKGIRVTCEDTGIGISEESQKKLFKAFEKIELGDKIALNSTGVGLGLVISNNLVQRLNASVTPDENTQAIKFHSKLDEGTCFYFEIYDGEDAKYDKTQSLGSRLHLNFPSSYDKFNQSNLDVSSELGLCGVSAMDLQRDIFSWTAHPDHPRDASLSTTFHKPTFSRHDRSQFELEIHLPAQVCRCSRVLIVDDDSFNLTALEQHLSKLHIKCDWAFNGYLALEKIKKRQHSRCSSVCAQYEVIFLDCNMPVMDGFETARTLREKIVMGEIDDLRIIACTAFVQQAELDRAREAGMDDFCTKPITFNIIREKLSLSGFWKRNNVKSLTGLK